MFPMSLPFIWIICVAMNFRQFPTDLSLVLLCQSKGSSYILPYVSTACKTWHAKLLARHQRRVNHGLCIHSHVFWAAADTPLPRKVVFLLVLILNVSVNSYGHARWSFHLTTLFSWASLTKRLPTPLCTYVRMYLTTTFFWISWRSRITE